MKKDGFYSSGEFAKLSHVTKKTLRYYDAHGILKPSHVTQSGARLYTTEDVRKMQQILLFKFLGFSLEEIRTLMLEEESEQSLLESLKLQRSLLENKMEQMELVRSMLAKTIDTVEKKKAVDWGGLSKTIDIAGLENSLKQQYKNATNISARIRLHKEFSTNKKGWFPWVYEQCDIKPGMKILELGCGDGSLWKENKRRIPKDCEIVLTDLSEGMLRDTRREISDKQDRFLYQCADMQELPFEDNCFDLVIANHVLFYANDLEQALSEIRRVLKNGGRLVCGTYGTAHMKEVSDLVSEFDDRIVLAAKNLYEFFGKQNGGERLERYFGSVVWQEYEDSLLVTDAEVMLSYVLSCHGNQNQYLVDKYKEFKSFVEKKVQKGFSITKEAGIFLAKKI